MTTLTLLEIEKFFTDSKPIDNAIKIEVRIRSSTQSESAIPFMTNTLSGLVIQISRSGATVTDSVNNVVVASIARLNELVVAPEYRGKGIAVAIIIAWAEANPWYKPANQAVRSQHGAVAYRTAWDIKLKEFYTKLIKVE